MRLWCSGNTAASQAVISGSSPDSRFMRPSVQLADGRFVISYVPSTNVGMHGVIAGLCET